MLGMQPNPFMDASKFLARLATIYLVQNNAFIVPMEDSAGRLIGYYPVLPQQSSVREYRRRAVSAVTASGAVKRPRSS